MAWPDNTPEIDNTHFLNDTGTVTGTSGARAELNSLIGKLNQALDSIDQGETPWHSGNDRLVLSLGHAVPIVYAAYADLGGAVGKRKADARALRVEDLSGLRELDSVLDGHPNPAEGSPFFDAATGFDGQSPQIPGFKTLAAEQEMSAVGRPNRIFIGGVMVRQLNQFLTH